MFPITKDVLKSSWKQTLTNAKISGLRWHDLRRHAILIMFSEKGVGYGTPKISFPFFVLREQTDQSDTMVELCL